MKQAMLLTGALLSVTTAVNVTEQLGCYKGEACRYKPEAQARMDEMMATKLKLWEDCTDEHECPPPITSTGPAKCVNNISSNANHDYPCNGVDLLSFVSMNDLGSPVRGNDMWGWTDTDVTPNREIAIMCMADGTSFIDITNPTDPTVLGYLKGTNGISSAWRDAKVFKNHVFIGSEASGHGMQVFDLTRLRAKYDRVGIVVPALTPDVTYDKFGNSHNIVINEATGYVYAVGTSTFRGGPHIVDVNDPLKPVEITGWDSDGYTHDAECVIYHGPDTRYTDHELCFLYNEDSLTILDVTDKDNLVQVSRTEYENNYYCHQGWLTEDHAYLLMDDELDETNARKEGREADYYTRTLHWSVEDLTKPKHLGSHVSTEMAVDHNLYIHNGLAYQSNYCAGLRILEAKPANVRDSNTPEVAYFDVAPYCETKTKAGVEFQGTWSNYPFFKSGTIAVSSIELGLFVLKRQS